ncbi:Hypothetical protein FKW44_012489 [Caligus rogercresseyi]|uniref:Uncharacterized protein n=1 Tax=Caligus rogercresseyi TaxID=217165 RepID=A0A7T8HJK1_CALRO|nr:Hypothetical protein FKW44_012489 [Caligus rogercresseyi]
MFLKKFREKRPEMTLYFPFENLPCRTTKDMNEFLGAEDNQGNRYPDFFYFSVMKKMPKGLDMISKSFQK